MSFSYTYIDEITPVITPHDNYGLQVLRWKARDNSDLPPVVCVHGLTRRAEDFIRLGEALSRTRDIYSFSMIGRGKSSRGRPEQYVYPVYVRDCLCLMKHYGLGTVDWVGTSLGGIIAMLIAGADDPAPSPIRRLVLNDIGPFISAASLRDLALRIIDYKEQPFQTRAAAEAYCRFAWEPFGIDDEQIWNEFMSFNIAPPGAGGFALHFDPKILDGVRNPGAITDVSLWSFYCRMTCPTLVLHGEHSTLLAPETMAQMATQGPKPKFVTFSGCGHAPSLMEPAQIGAVAGFLNQP